MDESLEVENGRKIMGIKSVMRPKRRRRDDIARKQGATWSWTAKDRIS